MSLPSVHEALIYLMIVTSASDRDMADIELGSIGEVVRTWPIFEDFDKSRLLDVAQDCQVLLSANDGLEHVLELAHQVIPTRLRDTAYAAVFEVAAADLEMRLEEARILQRVREHLDIDALSVAAIEMATKARVRTLT
ncbi:MULTISPECIES: tellurite resistance TerB family protein [Mesorhizobium]|uniref:Tellurite resistance protein TerB n=1 Tax=Mesorhizobium denitrificans TaxID=2294114 RepID=A0A371XD33_9HYPH|nr:MULTISPECIES: tellurite resistance TerB family protein [Mesorhizobium]RFC67126.1 Tellurite resistance protein TerB [Mesorhizobium denitrificans]